jgi:molecular chaperone DnaK (HSP70)
MLADAERFKEDDIKAKQTIEARNNYENLVYQFKGTLSDEKISSQIDELLKEKLTSIINENVKWLEHNQNASKEEYDYRLKNFQEAMKPLQEKMMYSTGMETGTGVPSTASKEPDIADID